MPSRYAIYQKLRATRSDLTDWVIHWTRDQLESSAYTTLLKIINEGILLPGFAPRGQNKKATIYGPQPAVCFTEQSLIEFAQYVKLRRDRNAVTGYGIAVHREDLFAEGGLPVISGLSCASEAQPGDPEYQKGQRILKDFPLQDQFRYVAFSLEGLSDQRRLLDWTYEREWRWPMQKYAGTEDPEQHMSGFPLAGSGRASSNLGMSKGRFHLVVEHDQDIDIFKAALNAVTQQSATFWRYPRHIPNARVYSLETVVREVSAGRLEYRKIDTHP